MKNILQILWLSFCIVVGATLGGWSASKPTPMSNPTPNTAEVDLGKAAEGLDVLSDFTQSSSDFQWVVLKPFWECKTPLDQQFETSHEGKTYRTQWTEVKP